MIHKFRHKPNHFSSSSIYTVNAPLSLRPFLKPERQGKVDRALQLARMIHLGKQLFSIWGT